jgi:hypothetical protein
VAARVVIAASTFYFACHVSGANQWRLFKTVAAVQTQLGAGINQTLTGGLSYRLGLDVSGATITMLVDGVPIVSVTDIDIPDPGRAGVRLQAQATAATGMHLDNWRAVSS